MNSSERNYSSGWRGMQIGSANLHLQNRVSLCASNRLEQSNAQCRVTAKITTISVLHPFRVFAEWMGNTNFNQPCSQGADSKTQFFGIDCQQLSRVICITACRHLRSRE
jgi:hypothetical protein